MESQFDEGLRKGVIAEERVDHAAMRPDRLPEDREEIVGRFAIVDRDREIETPCKSELFGEDATLDVAR